MRYLSLLFIVGIMWWTWSLANRDVALNEDTHIGIQDDLRRVITEYLRENVPTATDITFHKFWTETIKANQVKATFSYSFDDGTEDGPARIGIEGYAILNRTIQPETEDESEFDVWSLDELYVLNNKVTFKEGITLQPDYENTDESK